MAPTIRHVRDLTLLAVLASPLILALALALAPTPAAAASQKPRPAPAALKKPSPRQVPVADRVILLGTGGGPIARISRSQPANLLEAGGKSYLIDIGAGTPRQVVRAGVNLNAIDAVFITHLHFDHTAGIMGFLALDWMARRLAPVDFYGPPGTHNLVSDTLKALASGEAIFRPELPDLQPMDSLFSGHDLDVTTAREVYRDKIVTVRAVENSHYDTMHLPKTGHGIDRSLSYRFDLADRSVVFTGDTGPSRAVEALARGADLLVSEVIDLDALIVSLRKRQAATGIDQQPLIDHMAVEHLTPENVGKLAAAAGVKMVVLSHIATPPGMETIDAETILAGVRKHYSGPVRIGEDLAVY